MRLILRAFITAKCVYVLRYREREREQRFVRRVFRVLIKKETSFRSRGKKKIPIHFLITSLLLLLLLLVVVVALYS